MNISKVDNYDIERNDLKYKNSTNFLSIIKKVSEVTFMPIIIGGKIRNLFDAEKGWKLEQIKYL